ncbi:hypothetical protein FN846DRAFT_781937 [Sphaerosporella brunnea]|uniref:Homeobox domain-containing protein n=1 Tax=Sphaerosporella brunnea TaxID=1250544 RepID=A0A5J5ER18_9PEZI|nr:hypothetical protein FN846DRAFT_781937 [Sphaerosporella brunnea]
MSSKTPSITPSPPPQQGPPTASRRPPRKSTLTQQQKNQKRQRATQEQLVTLEAEFNKNPTPTALVRERIALEINMTERSVQIWFQNRRAKIKTLAKKSIETGEDCDAIPESMRQYLALQAMESGKGFYMGDRYRMSAYGNGNMLMAPETQPQGKIVIHHFSCRSLNIGTWRRVGQNTMDLIVFYSPEKACLTYYINNDSAGYKIEYPFSYIKTIELETHDIPATSSPNGQQKQGQLVITLTRPPNFFMDSSGSGGFYQCGDFTEDQQASQVLTHYLGGHPKILAGQLAKLVTLEAFANRHAHAAQFPMYEHPSFATSAPVSPHIIRPASSNDIPTWPQPEVAPGHNFHHKHRRTRSRSVPVAIDFSQMQQNMPSFSFQDHNDQNAHLYAPAPMHPHALVNSTLPGNPLRIDTSSSEFLDYRPGSTGYPLSATTTASPSDYASPSMLNSALQQDGYGTPYSLPFLSPMHGPTNGVGQSISPISMDGGPVIASGSPPLSHMDRSSSAELYTTYDHTGALTEDLSELYSKQTLSLSSPPHMDDTEGMDMQHLMQFPMTHGLSPDPSGM